MKRGFTLIEALIALVIAAFLLTGVYRVVDGTSRQVRALEERSETLQQWFHLRRQISRDLERLLPVEPPERLVAENAETLLLRCDGGVVPDWRSGTKVEVIHRVRPDPASGGVVWERLVQPAGDNHREESMVTLKIDRGLQKAEFALLDAGGWHQAGETVRPPIRAVRWRFEWRDIGDWTLIRAITPPPPPGVPR